METATRIRDAARALLDRDGPEAVSMREVAAKVGITAMAIYRHYRDRDALLGALADEGFTTLAAELERSGRRARSPVAELARLFDGYLAYAEQYPHRFELMFARARPGARQWPVDFRAGRSPTGNVMMAAVGRALPRASATTVLEAGLALWAHAHGMVTLWRGGRIGLPRAKFVALFRRSLAKVLDAYR